MFTATRSENRQYRKTSATNSRRWQTIHASISYWPLSQYADSNWPQPRRSFGDDRVGGVAGSSMNRPRLRVATASYVYSSVINRVIGFDSRCARLHWRHADHQKTCFFGVYTTIRDLRSSRSSRNSSSVITASTPFNMSASIFTVMTC